MHVHALFYFSAGLLFDTGCYGHQNYVSNVCIIYNSILHADKMASRLYVTVNVKKFLLPLADVDHDIKYIN